MYRIRSLAGADGRVFGNERTRLLRVYLSATTFLYTYGVVFTFFPVRTDLAYGNPIGGVIAIVLGIGSLILLAVRPNRLVLPTVAAIAATPIVMAFHVSIAAEYVCLIAPMFLAMYLRALHPPRLAWPSIAVLTAGCLAAVAVAPAPHVGVITFLIMAVAIIGAAESFGLLMRATFTAACTDAMTGLLNRAGWEIATSELADRLRTGDTPVTVVALDIDGLKALNDTYGHQAGDRRITEYAEHWRRAAPRGAVLARLGGDEFAACLATKKTAVVDGFVDQIRLRTPEVSIGTAVGDLSSDGIGDLYARADAELYRSRGRPLRDDSAR